MEMISLAENELKKVQRIKKCMIPWKKVEKYPIIVYWIFSGIFALYSGSFGGEPPALHFHLQLSLLFTEYLNRYINAFL